jgi:hypothetical protein
MVTATTKLETLFPGKAQKILEELTQRAVDDFAVINLMGWAAVGQGIVYGYERLFGFCNAANICSKVETAVRRLKRKKQWEEDTYIDVFTDIMADALVDRMQNGKG